MSVPFDFARACQELHGLAHDGAAIQQAGEFVALGEPDELGAMPPMREQRVAQEERRHQAGESGDGHELRGARLAVEPFLGEFLVLLEQRDLLLFLVVLELHAQLRDFANAIERALFAHAPQVFALVGERGRVVADGGVRARAQLVELGDVVGRLRAAGRDGAIELRHGFLGAAEREEQPAAQRRQRAVVVVVHAAGLAQRQLGAIAPVRRLR